MTLSRGGQLYAVRRKAGRCVWCGKKAGGRLCPTHLLAEREAARRLRAAKAAAGRCAAGQCRRDPAGGKTCPYHRAANVAANRAWRAKQARGD